LPRPRRTSIGKEIRNVRQSLAAIDASLARLADLLQNTSTRAGTARVPAKRRLPLSPKRRAALKQQGQYMGYLRNLLPRQKARVKAVKAAKGHAPAIRLARKLAQS
jgi:hypothetical protein